MFTWIINKIKTVGISSAIDALDNLEKPFGDHLEGQLDKIRKFNGRELATWTIDEIQKLLRTYAKIVPPQPRSDNSMSRI